MNTMFLKVLIDEIYALQETFILLPIKNIIEYIPTCNIICSYICTYLHTGVPHVIMNGQLWLGINLGYSLVS